MGCKTRERPPAAVPLGGVLMALGPLGGRGASGKEALGGGPLGIGFGGQAKGLLAYVLTCGQALRKLLAGFVDGLELGF